jgi:CTP:molybdopterin cytidylyltransferase MocA
VDAVILAAGRGTRVGELAPPFFKPLLPIDGVPLVCRAYDLARAVDVVEPVVVVAPENAAAIDAALGPNRRAALVVQRQPYGPGHALALGLRVAGSSRRVLVLLSDNVSTVEDVLAVSSHETSVGVKKFNRDDALRFTWLVDSAAQPGQPTWIESKNRRPYLNRTSETVTCWVGPFVGWRPRMETVLQNLLDDFDPNLGELLIGPYLNLFMIDEKSVTVPVSSYDVGTIDAYREATS